MASEHPETVVIDFPLHAPYLADLRDRRDTALERWVAPSECFPANPFGGAVVEAVIRATFFAGRAAVVAHAALTGAMHVEF